MTRTALDPSRSERLADQVFENEQLRDVLAERLATGMTAAIPGEIAVPPELILQAANLALDDPAVQDLVRDGIVATHRNALEGNAQPTTIDASALGSATRAALISLSPDLDAVVPQVPPVEVTLPTTGLSFLGKIRNFVKQATTILGALAFVGALAALVLTTDRPGVLRRVATWALGASAFWMAVGFGVPWLATKIGPSSGTIVSAIVDVFFGAMIQPAIVLALIGAALFGASFIWSGASMREPRAAGATAGRSGGSASGASASAQGRQSPSVSSNIRPPSQAASQPRPTSQAQPAPQQPAQARQPAPHQHRTGQQQAVPPQSPSPLGDPAGATPQQSDVSQYQRPSPIEPDPWAATAPAPQDRPATPQEWVEGVGYVEEDKPDQA